MLIRQFLLLVGSVALLTVADAKGLNTIVFFNNSGAPVEARTVEDGEISDEVAGVIEPLQRIRKFSEPGTDWVILNSSGKALVRYVMNDDPEQVVFVLPPRDADRKLNQQMENARLEDVRQRLEDQKKASAEKKETPKQKAEDSSFITGAFGSTAGYFFQETNHKGDTPARWTLRNSSRLDSIDREFEEVGRGPNGVELKDPSTGMFFLLGRDGEGMKFRNAQGRAWNVVFDGGEWMDRKELMAKVWAADQGRVSQRGETSSEKETETAQEKVQGDSFGFMTGAFKINEGIFFQETNRKGDTPAQWTARRVGQLDLIDFEFEEVSRDADGLVLKEKKTGTLLLIARDGEGVKARSTTDEPWSPFEPGGKWMDREEVLAGVVATEEANAREAAAEVARNAAEKERANQPLPFMITKAFESGNGLFVNVRPRRWEFWPEGELETKLEFVEESRDGNGITLKGSGEAADIRLKEDHYEWKRGGVFVVPEDNVVAGGWIFDEVRDLLSDREEAIEEQRLAALEEAKKWRGGNPELIKELRKRPDFKKWLATDQRGVEGNKRTIEVTDKETFNAIDYMQFGFHLLYMNPRRPSRNGLDGEYKLIDLDTDFQPYYKSTSIAKILPLSLSVRYRGSLKKVENSQVFFSGQSRSVGESTNVSVGIEAGGGKKKGSAEAGYGNTKERMNSSEMSRSTVYTEARAYYCDVILDKKYIRLHKDLLDRIMPYAQGKTSDFQTPADFDRFFEQFGTHYAIREMIGGKIWEEATIESQSLASMIAESTTVSGGVSVPIKAVQLSSKFSRTDSETVQNSSGTTIGRRTLDGFGGSMIAAVEEWEVDNNNTESMEPLRVMLRPTAELLWPQLFPVQTREEARRIDALRTRMSREIRDYIAHETRGLGENQTGEPMVLDFNLASLECINNKDGDPFGNGVIDVFGKVTVEHDGIAKQTILDVDEGKYTEWKKGEGTMMPENPVRVVSMPIFEKYGETPNGMPLFSTKYNNEEFTIKWDLTDSDVGKNSLISRGSDSITLNVGYLEPGKEGSTSFKIGNPANGDGQFKITLTWVARPVTSEDNAIEHPDWF